MPYADPEAQRAYQREWVARRRAEWLAENGPCVECGSTFELEVDHIDGNTKVDHRIWSWSKSRRDAELAKCQVLCSPCHLAKTVKTSIEEKTHCPKGHPYSPENTAIYNGARNCRTCYREKDRRRRAEGKKK